MAETEELSLDEQPIIVKEITDRVKTLKEQLQEIPVDMRLFSLSMRSLYAENAVGTDNECSVEFRKLRDDTRNDAIVYLKNILPLSSRFVESISEYFGWFDNLDFDEWKNYLKNITMEVINYREICETLVKLHEEILVSLKKKQDQAILVVAQCKNLEEKFKEMTRDLEKEAKAKRSWAVGLAFIPLIAPISGAILKKGSDNDVADAIENAAEAVIHKDAAIAVRHTLIPALQNFIQGMSSAAGFFSVTEHELQKFENKADKDVENRKKLYYKIMRKEAKEIEEMCRQFYAVLPAVTTDFQAIPTEGTDQNYVDKWLERKKEIIESTCNNKTLVVSLM